MTVLCFYKKKNSGICLCLVTLTQHNVCYRILERIGARALSAHLRKFCDYVIFQFTISEESQHVKKCADAISNMIWKYSIVTIDRLILCMVS